MKKQRAIFTFVFNEAVMLPLWFRYYSKYFAPEDMYILDHGSTDESIDMMFGCCNITRLAIPPIVDCEVQLTCVSQRQVELLSQYETVVYTDVDEIILPHPSLGTLGNYLDTFDRDFVSCNGHVVLHKVEEEQPLNYRESILDQRGWWFPSRFSDKPIVTRVPMKWDLGCHSQKQKSDPQKDNNLYMLHLQRVDYELCRQRHKNVSVREANVHDAALGYGTHRYITDEPHFKSWFYTDEGALAKAIPIPQELRDTRAL